VVDRAQAQELVRQVALLVVPQPEQPELEHY